MIEKHYTETANVKRSSGWTTDVDGFDVVDEVSAGSITGHLQQASAEYIINLASVFTLSHLFWCSPTSDVQEGDVLEINGNYYGVRGIQDNSFIGTNAHLELQLEKYTDQYGS